MNGLVNEWEMLVEEPFDIQSFPAPVFTPDEIAALASVQAAWVAFAGATPKSIDDEAEAMRTREWSALVDACRHACSTFSIRGTLEEAQ